MKKKRFKSFKSTAAPKAIAQTAGGTKRSRAAIATTSVARRKASPIDIAYQSFSRMWSKQFGKKSERMSKDEFIFFADVRGIDLNDSEKLLRTARQRVASESHQLTTEQARNLRRELLNLGDADLKDIGLTMKDIRTMKTEEFKDLTKDKAFISKFYRVLKDRGLNTRETSEWMSSEIFGSP